MAPSLRRQHTAATMLLLSLLLLAVVVSHAAKEAAKTRSQAELQGQKHHQLDDEATMGLTAVDERCGGAGGGGEAEDEEECLMRRTLVAHTDYIYTQGGGHN